MATQRKTPGVYVVEENAFPSSVVQVPTSIPVFVGHTQFARRGTSDLTGEPVRIASLMEFNTLFGGPPVPTLTVSDGAMPEVTVTKGGQYTLYASMRLYFDNGGGPCWIISVGSYERNHTASAFSAPFTKTTGALEKLAEPTIVCIPEAVKLSLANWASLSNAVLDHCGRMQSRVAILDVFDGYLPRNSDAKTDVITGSDAGFRNKIVSENLSYGAAYYPWLNTSIFTSSDISIDHFDDAGKTALSKLLEQEGNTNNNKKLLELAQHLKPDAKDKDKAATTGGEMTAKNAHNAALQLSPGYAAVMDQALRVLNLLPPSAAMAGVYARTDTNSGVFRAPANTGLTSVISPVVALSSDEQEDLNVPLDGKAVNAIRSFIGRGVLVWGARTLDGNSQDWRYINVRRTMIMLEQSIKYAAEPYVFAPNTASTWVTVRNVIANFLDNQWKAGALAGATPAEAYAVDVGLGSTMTPNDVLDGYMKVVVRVAVVRPAEFIVLTFQQKMQTS